MNSRSTRASFFLFPLPSVEKDRKWRTKLLSYPNVKPRKISKRDSEIHTARIHVHMHGYLKDRRDLHLPYTGPSFAVPLRLKLKSETVV